MRFGRIYSEFRETWVRWNDHFSFIVNDFPIFLVRRYDFLEDETSVFTISVLGFDVFRSFRNWN